MALVVTNGSKWGALTTTGTTGGAEAPLPMCLARLVQNKNQVLHRPALCVNATTPSRACRKGGAHYVMSSHMYENRK